MECVVAILYTNVNDKSEKGLVMQLIPMADQDSRLGGVGNGQVKKSNILLRSYLMSFLNLASAVAPAL